MIFLKSESTLIILYSILTLFSCSGPNLAEIESIRTPNGFKIIDAAFQKTNTGEYQPTILYQNTKEKSTYFIYPQKKIIYIKMFDYIFGEDIGTFYYWGYCKNNINGCVFDSFGLFDEKGKLLAENDDFFISDTGRNYFNSLNHGDGYYKYYWNDNFINYSFKFISGGFRNDEKSFVVAVFDRDNKDRIRILEYNINENKPKVLGSFVFKTEYLEMDKFQKNGTNYIRFHFLEDDSFLMEYAYSTLNEQSYWGVVEESFFDDNNEIKTNFEKSLFYDDDTLYKYGEEIVTPVTRLDLNFSQRNKDILLAHVSLIKDNAQADYSDLIIQSCDFTFLNEPLVYKTKNNAFRTLRGGRVSSAKLHDLGLRVQVGYIGNTPTYGVNIPSGSFGNNTYVKFGDVLWKGFYEFEELLYDSSNPVFALKSIKGQYAIAVGENKIRRSFDDVYDVALSNDHVLNILSLESAKSEKQDSHVFHYKVTE